MGEIEKKHVELNGKTIWLTKTEIAILQAATYDDYVNTLSIDALYAICKEDGLEAEEAQLLLNEMVSKGLATKKDNDVYDFHCGWSSYGLISDLEDSKWNDYVLKGTICP